MIKLKNFEVTQYLTYWVNNHGKSCNPEMGLIDALRCEAALLHWFNNSDVDYDENHALTVMKNLYK